MSHSRFYIHGKLAYYGIMYNLRQPWWKILYARVWALFYGRPWP